MSQSATYCPEGVPSQFKASAPALPFACVDVYTDPRAALDAWTELEALAPITGYQTRRFLLPWLDTLGERRGFTALISVARDATGKAVALLPFGIARRGPLQVAFFLGDRQSNFNLPLIRPGTRFDRAASLALLKETARNAPRRPDLYVLLNQPFAWADSTNPLAFLPWQESPSFAHGTRLSSDMANVIEARFSKQTRRKLKKKEARLGDIGPLTYERAATPERARLILDAFLAQKASRFSARGLDPEFARPQMRTFLDRAATRGLAEGRAAFELHALCVGERIVATYGAIRHGASLHVMFNSFDPDPQIAKSSPGDLLLRQIVLDACSRGVTQLDLGIGDARYKTSICDETIPLFDCIIPITLLGRIGGSLARLRLTLKRHIKRSPQAWNFVQAVRARGIRH